MHPSSPSSRDPIRSEFADDPDMAELVELFVSELPHRIDAVGEAVQTRDLKALARLAHQLRGAAPSYGFAQLGQTAGGLEDAIRACAPGSSDGSDPAQRALELIRTQVDQLVDVCRRIAM